MNILSGIPQEKKYIPSNLNKSDTKSYHILKEGVLVNSLIKDDNLTDSSMLLPSKDPVERKDVYQNKADDDNKKINNTLIALIAAPLVILGAFSALALAYKHSFLKKYQTVDPLRIPAQGRLIAVNNDNAMSLLMLVQDPSWKNLQVAMAVLSVSATGFIMKNIVDGIKEIWTKKEFASIKKNKEEELIDIETRSFAGKNKIIRNLIIEKKQELDNFKPNIGKQETTESQNKISFKGSDRQNKKFTDKIDFKLDSPVFFTILGLISVGASVLLSRSIVKNIREVSQKLSQKATQLGQKITEDMTKIKSADELEHTLENSAISEEAKDFARKEWDKIHNSSGFAPTSELIAGTRGKTGFSSVVKSEASAFIYTWLINKTPQTQTLATIMCAATGLGYTGSKVVEAVKEIQVEKANTKTDIELQNNLVDVELKNFYQKKTSYITPIMNDCKLQLEKSQPKDKADLLKQSVLLEIKNGPPFVYS